MFKIVVINHREDVQSELLFGLNREEAITFMEEKLESGIFNGKRFRKVSVSRWQAFDHRNIPHYTAEIVREKS